ncbi:MAG: repressor LexA, partial [Candidatus Pacebacteria bacterium]|nr:repressor LexA [Candidatus Paceibacterota bacterium]
MLTKRQKQILDYIRDFIEEKGYSPSLEDIRRHFRLSSRSTAHYYVEILTQKGYLNKLNYQARAIELSDEKQASGLIEIPLVGTIAAGQPIEAIEIPEEGITIAKDEIKRPEECYALRVK